MSSGNGTTWSNGIALGSEAGNVKVSSDTNFTTETRITMNPTASGRYWCSRTGAPMSDNPGAVMGDWKDR